MIRKITFNNFYSFKDEQVIDFTTSKKRTYDYSKSQIDSKQITNIAGFISKNAAGKTNAMRVLGFIASFVNTRTAGEGDMIAGGYKTFFNNTKRSDFGIEFEIDTSVYTFSFSVCDGLLLREQLQKDKEDIYLYEYINAQNTLESDKSFDIFKGEFLKNFTRKMSFIAYVNALGGPFALTEIEKFFNAISININELGQRTPEVPMIFKSSEQYARDKTLKKEMEIFINNFDLGPDKVFEIDFETKNEDGKKILNLYSSQQINNVTEKINFWYESTGTRAIYYLLADLFTVLKNGGVLVIDEIETGLHPEALSKILSYFIDENKNDAQLIFSTHNLDFLKKFNKTQVFIVDKNNEGESDIKRLDSIASGEKGGRPEDNIYAKYRSGLYGSYPDITV